MWTGWNEFRHNMHILVAQCNTIENRWETVTSMNDILKESLAVAKSKNRCPFELNQKEEKKGKPETKAKRCNRLAGSANRPLDY